MASVLPLRAGIPTSSSDSEGCSIREVGVERRKFLGQEATGGLASGSDSILSCLQRHCVAAVRRLTLAEIEDSSSRTYVFGNALVRSEQLFETPGNDDPCTLMGDAVSLMIWQVYKLCDLR